MVGRSLIPPVIRGLKYGKTLMIITKNQDGFTFYGVVSKTYWQFYAVGEI